MSVNTRAIRYTKSGEPFFEPKFEKAFFNVNDTRYHVIGAKTNTSVSETASKVASLKDPKQ